MPNAHEVLLRLAADLPTVRSGTMFGCPCLKVPSGKVAVIQWHDDLLFKLDADGQRDLLSLDGTRVFQPRADRPPMNGWIQVPPAYADRWTALARQAAAYVATLV
jgi:hypothetical protein